MICECSGEKICRFCAEWSAGAISVYSEEHHALRQAVIDAARACERKDRIGSTYYREIHLMIAAVRALDGAQ